MYIEYSFNTNGGGEYTILGAWRRSDIDSVWNDRDMRLLEPGDIVEPVFDRISLLGESRGTIETISIGRITVTEQTSVYEKSLGDGYFSSNFLMIDYAGRRYTSALASLRVRQGEIERLPGGLVPEVNEWISGTLEGWRVRAHCSHGLEDGCIDYITIEVTPEMYEIIANMVGLPYTGGDSTGDFRIQIISDTIDLTQYIGMELVYIAASNLFANPTSSDYYRDIIIVADEIHKVW